MDRLKVMFPTLAHMDVLELLLLPVALVFLVAPVSVLIHRAYVSMGWIAADGRNYAFDTSIL